MGFVAFTIEQAKDIWRAVRKIDGMRGDGVENTANSISIKAVPVGGGRGIPAGDTRRWAKISSNATKAGTYNGKSGSRNATAFDEAASGALSISTYYDFVSTADVVLVNYFEPGIDSHILPVDAVVYGFQVGATVSNKPLIEIDHIVSGLFAVALTQTGGSDGSASAAASYTYTVKTIDSATTLGTGVGQTRPRPNGLVVPGTKGLAYYDGTTLKLWDAGEVPETAACS